MYKRITNPSILIALIAVFAVGVFFLIGCGDDDTDITHADDDHVEGDEHDDEHAEAEHVEGDEHAASENAKALIRVESPISKNLIPNASTSSLRSTPPSSLRSEGK